MKNGWYERLGDLNHYVNNKWHNEKSPAYIFDDGSKLWRQNDKVHRIDGPAIEWYDGDKDWYYRGKELKFKSQQEFERYLKLKSLW